MLRKSPFFTSTVAAGTVASRSKTVTSDSLRFLRPLFVDWESWAVPGSKRGHSPSGTHTHVFSRPYFSWEQGPCTGLTPQRLQACCVGMSGHLQPGTPHLTMF
jgi:hypothetical protein